MILLVSSCVKDNPIIPGKGQSELRNNPTVTPTRFTIEQQTVLGNVVQSAYEISVLNQAISALGSTHPAIEATQEY